MGFRKPSTVFVSYDKTLFMISIGLMLFGLILQLDIGSSRGSENSLQYFTKQLMFVLFSIPIMIGVARYNKLYEIISKYSFLLLAAISIVLVLVLLIGTTAKGGTRWIRFGGVGLQPSMPAAMILIFYISKMLDKKRHYIERSSLINFVKDFLPLLIACVTVFGLIYAEKHLSTLIVLGASVLGIFFVANIRFSTLLILVLGVGSLALFVIKHGEEDYRSSRMDIFSKYSLYHKALNLKVSQEETNDYQVKESLTAITSGKIFGKGFSKGRAKHYFLPDAKSDYIYAIIGEQFGFIGAIIILALYTFVFLKSCKIAWSTDEMFLQLSGVGLALNFYLTAMVNIGVAISAIPPTGLTLPFLSYGGTSLLMNAINMGLILNMSAQRKVIA